MMAKPAVDQAPEDGTVYKKRSFLRLPVEVDCALLLADYRSIPAEAWSTSHWDTHCSADMLLLRGGDRGSASDFSTDKIRDYEIQSGLPYLSFLIGEDGPFGQTTYAFIFRMKPMGVTRAHWDQQPIWKNLFRVHIPITTNPDAVLMSEKRAKHFPVGEAWTFDNQKMHGVVNGDSVRTHLIIDVPHGPKLYALLQAAEWDPGVESPEPVAADFGPQRRPTPCLYRYGAAFIQRTDNPGIEPRRLCFAGCRVWAHGTPGETSCPRRRHHLFREWGRSL